MIPWRFAFATRTHERTTWSWHRTHRPNWNATRTSDDGRGAAAAARRPAAPVEATTTRQCQLQRCESFRTNRTAAHCRIHALVSWTTRRVARLCTWPWPLVWIEPNWFVRPMRRDASRDDRRSTVVTASGYESSHWSRINFNERKRSRSVRISLLTNCGFFGKPINKNRFDTAEAQVSITEISSVP